jgi:hypothetical protein
MGREAATTDENTVVLLGDFYRAGDGNDESFTAQMIVSADDIARDILGIQNVWIRGVGAGNRARSPRFGTARTIGIETRDGDGYCVALAGGLVRAGIKEIEKMSHG